MTYDCFSFFNELDLLEIRLRTLSDVVDRFVLAESRYTHTGNPKPLYYQENAARFAAFADRIVHVVAPDPDDLRYDANDQRPSWVRENAQRNATIDAILPQLEDDDLLIVSDLDEIPAPDAVRAARRIGRPVVFRQKMYYHFLNCRNCTSPFWYGSVALTFRDFTDAQTYAHLDTGIADGGLAGRITDEFIADCIANGGDIFRHGERFFAERTTRGFPAALADFPSLVYPVDAAYLRRVRLSRLLAYAKWLIRPLAWRLLPHAVALRLSHWVNR